MKKTLIVLMAFLGTLANAEEHQTFGCYYNVVENVHSADSESGSEPKLFELKAPVVYSDSSGGGVTEEIFEFPEKPGFGVEVYIDQDGQGNPEYVLAVIKILNPEPNLATESLASTDLRSDEGYDDYVTVRVEDSLLAAKCTLNASE